MVASLCLSLFLCFHPHGQNDGAIFLQIYSLYTCLRDGWCNVWHLALCQLWRLHRTRNGMWMDPTHPYRRHKITLWAEVAFVGCRWSKIKASREVHLISVISNRSKTFACNLYYNISAISPQTTSFDLRQVSPKLTSQRVVVAWSPNRCFHQKPGWWHLPASGSFSTHMAILMVALSHNWIPYGLVLMESWPSSTHYIWLCVDWQLHRMRNVHGPTSSR